MSPTIGLLVSIKHGSAPRHWANLARSVDIVRPLWSSLAIDTWGPRGRIRHAAVLARFTRVLYLKTTTRAHMDKHAQPSGSYALHWLHAFAAGAHAFSRKTATPLTEAMPDLLMGLDADTVVPTRMPLDAYAVLLAHGAEGLNALPVPSRASAAARTWVQGRTPACPAARQAGAPTRVVYVHPVAAVRNHANISSLHQWPAHATHQLRVHSRAGCPDYRPHRAPTPFARDPDAFARRGPHCPPTTFWILDHRTLPLLLATMRVWHDAMTIDTRNQSNALGRIEYVGCALLAPDEGVMVHLI